MCGDITTVQGDHCKVQVGKASLQISDGLWAMGGSHHIASMNPNQALTITNM
jgi:hypothetical protein